MHPKNADRTTHELATIKKTGPWKYRMGCVFAEIEGRSGSPHWCMKPMRIVRDVYYMQFVHMLPADSENHRLRPIGVPRYLEIGWDIKIIANFRFGSPEYAEFVEIDHWRSKCWPTSWGMERLMLAGGGGLNWMNTVYRLWKEKNNFNRKSSICQQQLWAVE